MMVVGDADAGKSCCINVLSDALNSIDNNPRFYKVSILLFISPVFVCANFSDGGIRRWRSICVTPSL